jgi:hypothetical protein
MRQLDARTLMDSDLEGVELATALALWSFADDSGRCWPSLRSLCRRAGWSERTVQRALRALEATGLLTAHYVPERVTPTYVLHLAALKVEGGCQSDTPGVTETPPVSERHPPVSGWHPPVSERHPPVSVWHPNPPENPPENPPLNPSEESMSAAPTKRRRKAQATAEPTAPTAEPTAPTAEPTAPTAEPTAPTAAQRERSEAEHCFARLEELRLSRHAGGRGLSAAVWVPKVRTVLAKVPAQDLYDAMVWLLHDPAAAWHRGEDSRNPSADRTVDLACILRHPEYALRRTWTGAQAPTPAELAEQRPDQPAPAWVQRQAQSPSGRRAAAAAARIARENAEAEAWLAAQQPDLDDSDVPF